MPSRTGKQNSEINVFGAVLGDALSRLRLVTDIKIVANGNNPPTVQAGTNFQVYGTDTFTSSPATPTLNNVYPANTSLTYYLDSVIFEIADQTFAWNTAASATSAGIPAKSNSTVYFLFCNGGQDVDSTSRGKGKYGVSTNAPTYDTVKKGWYSADGLVIGTFRTDGSGNVINIQPFCDELYKTKFLQYIGGQTYNGVALNVTSTNGTLVRAVLTPYQSIDGTWNLKGKISFTYSPSSSPSATIAGVVFKNVTGYDQPVIWSYAGGASTGQCHVSPNTGNIVSHMSGTFSAFDFYFDAELESKPTWAY